MTQIPPFSSLLPPILNKDTHCETFQSICHHLSTSSAISLSRVCRQLSDLYRYLLVPLLVYESIFLQNTPNYLIPRRCPTTAGINVISWCIACGLFALPISVQRKAYLTRPLGSESREQVARYSHQEWKAQAIPWPEKQRRVGDHLPWIIDFPTHHITCEPTAPDFVLEYIHVQLCEEEDSGTGLRFCAVQAETFTAPVLRSQYTHNVRESRFMDSTRPKWRDHLLGRIARLTVFKLELLQCAQRPRNYIQIHGQYRKYFKRPIPDSVQGVLLYRRGFRSRAIGHRNEETPALYHVWESICL